MLNRADLLLLLLWLTDLLSECALTAAEQNTVAPLIEAALIEATTAKNREKKASAKKESYISCTTQLE